MYVYLNCNLVCMLMKRGTRLHIYFYLLNYIRIYVFMYSFT